MIMKINHNVPILWRQVYTEKSIVKLGLNVYTSQKNKIKKLDTMMSRVIGCIPLIQKCTDAIADNSQIGIGVNGHK